MFVRAYLRASTDEQDANRAREPLVHFTAERGHKVAAFYVENESGTRLDRPELFRLLEDSHQGDVILVEGVDRLSRLDATDWARLRAQISSKGLRVVALDLPTSHQGMRDTQGDEFTARMLDAINSMLLDMLAAIARKDYEDRRRRQAQGIAKAKASDADKYKGRPVDAELHERIKACRNKGMSLRETAKAVGCALSTVQRALAG